MATAANLSISLMLCIFYTGTTSYHVNFTVYRPTQCQLLHQNAEQINSTNIHTVINRSVTRNVNTNRQTSQLVVSTFEILYKILSPNYKWGHLNDLHFDNNISQICLSKDYLWLGIERSTCDISFPQLTSLTLNYFTDCERLLDKIINCFQMGQLEIIKFIATINDGFIQQFHELLRKDYGSLKEFYLSGLLLTRINIFEIRANYTLGNVSAVYLKPRLEDNVIVAKYVINDRFCSIFPNLVKLGIKQTAIDLDQIFKLQNCTKIKYLKSIIYLESNDLDRFLRINWKSQFPVLENIAVKLVFDYCPSPEIFELLTNHMTHLGHYTLCSNCNLTRNRQMQCTQRAKH